MQDSTKKKSNYIPVAEDYGVNLGTVYCQNNFRAYSKYFGNHKLGLHVNFPNSPARIIVAIGIVKLRYNKPHYNEFLAVTN